MVGLAQTLAARAALEEGTKKVREIVEEEDDFLEAEAWAGVASLPQNRTLRSKKLTALSSEELSIKNLRSLFRLLDDDGSGEVSADEIQRGLVLLGFPEAHDPVALSRVVGEIDDDNTGTITEGEFLAFFGGQTRETLGKLLKGYVLNHTYIMATKYGHVDGKDVFEQVEVPSGAIKKWMADNFDGNQSKTNLWLDVVGFDPETFKTLGQVCEVDTGVLSEALLFRWPEIKALESSTGTIAVVHHLSLSDEPLLSNNKISLRKRLHPPFSWVIDLLLGQDPVMVPQHLEGKRLKPKETVSNIAISLEQSTIITLGKRLLLTFRVPVTDLKADEVAAISAELNRQSSWKTKDGSGIVKSASKRRISLFAREKTVRSPFASDDSGLRTIYEDVRRKMQLKTPDVLHLYKRTGKGLAVVLLDSIMSGNYIIRDTLADWEELLEATIRGQYSSQLSTHLDAITSLTLAFERVLKPLATALLPNTWMEEKTEQDENKPAEGSLYVSPANGERFTPKAGGDHVSPKDVTRSFRTDISAWTDGTGSSVHLLKNQRTVRQLAEAEDPNGPAMLLPQEETEADMTETDMTLPGGVQEQNQILVKPKDVYNSSDAVQAFENVSPLSRGANDRPGQSEGTVGRNPADHALHPTFSSIIKYLRMEQGEYFELAMDVRVMVKSMQDKRERIEEMKKLLVNVKADMMNRTLYALTLITAVSTPITIATGVFGMNFADMTELDPELGGAGYKLFWILIGSILAFITLAFTRLRLLEALK